MPESPSPEKTSTSVARLRLKPNRHFPFHARHPWVHAHALADLGNELKAGEIVELLDHDGNWIARGLINPGSRLRVRLYSFHQDLQIGDDLWRQRIDSAIARRRRIPAGAPGGDPADQAQRLVFSESDLFSGLIVDRYADCLSVQLTAGALLPWRSLIIDHLRQATGCRAVKVRMDEKTAKHENIEPFDDWISEDGADAASDGIVEYLQNGLLWSVDLRTGQKTGSYLDQRVNHRVAAGYLTGRKVLDVCCYHGGFGLVAAKSGAESVLGIDSSNVALENAQKNADRNELSGIQFLQDDCFDALKRLGDEGRRFDAVVLDPPRFAGSRHQVDAAMRAYRRLNSLALDLLPSGGILVTCSCSGRVTRADFHTMLGEVGKRKRRDLILMETRGPSADHPVAAACFESDYLKCVIAEVV